MLRGELQAATPQLLRLHWESCEYVDPWGLPVRIQSMRDWGRKSPEYFFRTCA